MSQSLFGLFGRTDLSAGNMILDKIIVVMEKNSSATYSSSFDSKRICRLLAATANHFLKSTRLACPERRFLRLIPLKESTGRECRGSEPTIPVTKVDASWGNRAKLHSALKYTHSPTSTPLPYVIHRPRVSVQPGNPHSP